MEKYTKISIALFIVLSLVSLLTHFTDSTDGGDYTDVAKYFAGDYSAKVRTSHSLMYGFVHAPLVGLTQNFLLMKVTNLIFLILISLSVYYISKKNEKALLLMSLSPIIWYLGPWISPLPLVTLLFLWGFFFIDKFYNGFDTEKIKYLIYSGLLMGIALCFWDGLMFILLIFIACFFYGKNVNNLLIFLAALVLGSMPLLILNQYLYGFPFYSLIKYFLTIIIFTVYGGFNGNVYPFLLQNYLAYAIIVPFFVYLLFSKRFFKEKTRESIFLILTMIFFLNNPQIRYLLLIWPIIIIYLTDNLDKKKFLIQARIFAVISMLIIAPYLVQIFYSTNNTEFTRLIGNISGTSLMPNQGKLLSEDLANIVKDYPNETFLVGNADDYYQALASLYWGKEVKEFVSIQDYNFFLKNSSVIFEKTLSSNPHFPDRRQLWISGGLRKNPQDQTDYGGIKLGIGINEPISINNFILVKKYGLLYLSEKSQFKEKTNSTG